ncbi:MAG: FeoA family protein [Pseudomonadota bacterium]|nr:FeoA family protein [Pseudomonadota bacterium]
MTKLCSLNTVPAGRCCIIMRIDADSDLTARMRALGLQLGRRIQVMRRSPFQGPIQVRSGQTDIIIRRADAAAVQVRPCDPNIEHCPANESECN